MRCFVQSCNADMHALSSTGFSTHRFPKDEDFRLRWWSILSAVPGAIKDGTRLENLNSARLCSRHFRDSDIRENNGKRVLKRDAVPRLFLHESDYDIESSGYGSAESSKILNRDGTDMSFRELRGDRSPKPAAMPVNNYAVGSSGSGSVGSSEIPSRDGTVISYRELHEYRTLTRAAMPGRLQHSAIDSSGTGSVGSTATAPTEQLNTSATSRKRVRHDGARTLTQNTMSRMQHASNYVIVSSGSGLSGSGTLTRNTMPGRMQHASNYAIDSSSRDGTEMNFQEQHGYSTLTQDAMPGRLQHVSNYAIVRSGSGSAGSGTLERDAMRGRQQHASNYTIVSSGTGSVGSTATAPTEQLNTSATSRIRVRHDGARTLTQVTMPGRMHYAIVSSRSGSAGSDTLARDAMPGRMQYASNYAIDSSSREGTDMSFQEQHGYRTLTQDAMPGCLQHVSNYAIVSSGSGSAGSGTLARDAMPGQMQHASNYAINSSEVGSAGSSVTSRGDPEMSIIGITSCNTTASTEQLNTSSGSQKRIRYAGDVTDLDNISPQEAKAVLPKFHKQLHDALKRNRRLKQQNYRLKKKLNKLETITNELKRQNIISTQGAILMKQQNCNELLKELTRGPSGNGYTAVVRTFATTVFFYSAKAYDYIREAFNFSLPHPSTIIRWYRSIDGNPGLTTEALQVLEVKASEKGQEGLPLLVDLCYDECAMRQHVMWNQFEKKFDGVVDFGPDLEDDGDTIKPAREILVFMVTSVDENWKIPVAYYVINGLNVEKKKGLVESVLRALQDINVTVIGLTFDGTSTNIGVANALGCHIRGDQPDQLKTSFRHPSGGHQVYVLLDACHMVKLVRNVFASQKTLRTAKGKVEWELLEKLVSKQNLHGLKLAKNLTDQHVDFSNMKMKVVLAVQLLSNSTANALELLKDIDAEFANCDATVEFVRVLNGVFDILNSRSAAGDGFKRPLCKENFEEIAKFLEYAEEYIRSIIIDSTGKPVLRTCYKTGFLGILVDINSFRLMYQEYVVEKQLLKEIPTYQFSQDHVERFFGAARAKGGCNDNPNFGQFKAAFKRLLNDNSITVSSKANILEVAQINTLVAGATAVKEPSIRKRKLQGSFKDIERKLLCGVPLDVNLFDDKFINAAVEVDARSVQKAVLKKLRCQSCLESIVNQENGSYLSGVIVQICRFTEVQFNILTGGHNAFNVGKYFDLLVTCSISRVQKDFPDIVDMKAHLPGPLIDHKQNLLQIVMESYLNIRLTRYSQQVQQSRISIRPKLSKLVHFNGY